MATLKALQDKIAKLQAQAEAIAKRESSVVFDKIRDLMKKHGLTADDIASHFRKPTAGSKTSSARKSVARAGTAKYLNPKTGATWTGHGRAPAWIANVKDRSKFLADESSASTAVSAKAAKATKATKAAKPGNYVRGPQAPMYRDPASGATWSGRGRAPAWLASSKDRTVFLIEKAEAASKKAAVKSAKKTAAKKVSVKKTAAKKATAVKKSAPAAKKAPAKKVSAKRAAVKKVAAKKATSNEISAPATGTDGISEIVAA